MSSAPSAGVASLSALARRLLPDGSEARIRTTTPSDRDGIIAFHRHLSDKTVFYRYFSPVSLEWRTAATRLADDLCNDAEHRLTLVVERRAAGSGVRTLVGIGRLVIAGEPRSAELAMTIRDDFQGMGLGAALLDALIGAARGLGLGSITAIVLAENRRMLELCKSRHFRSTFPQPGGPASLRLDLSAGRTIVS